MSVSQKVAGCFFSRLLKLRFFVELDCLNSRDCFFFVCYGCEMRNPRLITCNKHSLTFPRDIFEKFSRSRDTLTFIGPTLTFFAAVWHKLSFKISCIDIFEMSRINNASFLMVNRRSRFMTSSTFVTISSEIDGFPVFLHRSLCILSCENFVKKYFRQALSHWRPSCTLPFTCAYLSIYTLHGNLFIPFEILTTFLLYINIAECLVLKTC